MLMKCFLSGISMAGDEATCARGWGQCESEGDVEGGLQDTHEAQGE